MQTLFTFIQNKLSSRGGQQYLSLNPSIIDPCNGPKGRIVSNGEKSVNVGLQGEGRLLHPAGPTPGISVEKRISSSLTDGNEIKVCGYF
jgi:hypothetical protein